MLGSLGQFMEVEDSEPDKMQFILDQQLQIQHKKKNKFSRQRTEFVSDDKTIFLKSSNEKKNVFSQGKAKNSLRSSSLSNQKKKQHWVEKDYTKMPKLEKKHKLQVAVAKVKEQETIGYSKSFFENSFDRIMKGYSKIQKKPIINFIPKREEEKREIPEIVQAKKERKTSLSNQKIIEFQKSIEWAKKRKKDFKFYYQRLGKSVSLAVRENEGKNNYELQEEFERKQGEKVRRVQRKNLLSTLYKIKQPE